MCIDSYHWPIIIIIIYCQDFEIYSSCELSIKINYHQDQKKLYQCVLLQVDRASLFVNMCLTASNEYNQISSFRRFSMSFRYFPTFSAISLFVGLRIFFTVGFSCSKFLNSSRMVSYAVHWNMA